MHRIFFDTNEGTHAAGYELRLPASIADLAALGDELREGLRVVIVMPDELEMQADLSFDRESGYWIAAPVSGTIKYLD
jgi:hypothetical protein